MIWKPTPWQRAVLAVRVTRILEIAAAAFAVLCATKGCWLMLTNPGAKPAWLMVCALAAAVVTFWDAPMFDFRFPVDREGE